MKNIHSDFADLLVVPFNIAKKLKDVGFKNPCYGKYSHNQTFSINQKLFNHNSSDTLISAPFYDDAFVFIAKKLNTEVLIPFDIENKISTLNQLLDMINSNAVSISK